jgi:rhodanese-related sulfurtransferase
VLELNSKGITNAAALLGGLNAWKTAGYPVEGTPAK